MQLGCGQWRHRTSPTTSPTGLQVFFFEALCGLGVRTNNTKVLHLFRGLQGPSTQLNRGHVSLPADTHPQPQFLSTLNMPTVSVYVGPFLRCLLSFLHLLNFQVVLPGCLQAPLPRRQFSSPVPFLIPTPVGSAASPLGATVS